MIEYLNNPALLILALEVMAFLIIVNFILLFLLSRKNNKAVKALNVLVKDIKDKSEDNKKKMAEILLQPGLTDPEVIKQGMQNLVNGQTQLYKDMIKAIRTRHVDDVSILSNSVSDLIGSAINIGRESGISTANKEAEETKAKLESEKQGLEEEKQDLENKLQDSSSEMDMLMNEYSSMMNNVEKAKAEASGAEQSEQTSDQSENTDEPEAAEEIIDITAEETEEELIDIASEVEEAPAEAEQAAEAAAVDEVIASEEQTEEASDETAQGEQIEVDIADEMIDELLDTEAGEANKDSDKNAEQAA